MVTYLLKKSYQHKTYKEINFKDLWGDNGVFTTMWIFGRPAKILFFKKHIENLRNEIDMLWLTGELRLERPTPTEEINWANRFFKNAIFQAQIDVDEKFRRALVGIKSADEKIFPSIMFHSWVGGDRDGHTKVTALITKQAIEANKRNAIEAIRNKLKTAIIK